MILWPQPDGSVIATPQPAHALIAGQLMRALADPPAPFEAAVTAAAQHDCPWMAWEAAPERDPETGLPRAFNRLPGAAHVAMWEAGVELALAAWGSRVGLMVLLHGSHIYRLGLTRMPDDAPALQGYIARAPARAAAIMARIGATEAEVARTARQVALVDGIALALCWGHETFDCGGATLTRTEAFAATLAPWPLAVDRLEVETEALVLPGPFADQDAMRAGMAAAPRIALRFVLARA